MASTRMGIYYFVSFSGARPPGRLPLYSSAMTRRPARRGTRSRPMSDVGTVKAHVALFDRIDTKIAGRPMTRADARPCER